MKWLSIPLVLALSACAAISGPTLDGTEWLSTAVTEDGADRPLVDGTQINLRFADGQLGASAGCNTMSGAYRIDGDVLVFEGGAMTEMGCDDERHAQDDWLATFLGSRPTVAQAEDKLTLTSGATVVALEDREVAEPDLPLTETTWTLDSLISGDAVSSIPDGASATLTFTDDGHLQVDTGCNTGGGRYEVTDGTMRITELFTTLRGCHGALADVEAAVLAVLSVGEIGWSVDASSLTLLAGGDGLVLRGG
jgi:heat shock protein HslJ